MDQVSIGANRLVVAFLKGAVHLKPPVQAVTQWDLQVVLDRLCLAPYEPVEQADIRSLPMKTAFLLAITSARTVNKSHALSVSLQCLRGGPDNQIVTSVHKSTYSAGSIHAGGKGLAGSPIPSPYVDCLMTASWRVTDQLLDPARRVHPCQNKGLLTGGQTLLLKR